MSWADVGGLLDVKREMVETLQYPLKFAAKYERYGMSPSKGMLPITNPSPNPNPNPNPKPNPNPDPKPNPNPDPNPNPNP